MHHFFYKIPLPHHTCRCEGTVVGAPPNSPLAAALYTAGELLALMQGKRGVVTVQLWWAWPSVIPQSLSLPRHVRAAMRRELGAFCFLETVPQASMHTASAVPAVQTLGSLPLSLPRQRDACAGPAEFSISKPIIYLIRMPQSNCLSEQFPHMCGKRWPGDITIVRNGLNRRSGG